MEVGEQALQSGEPTALEGTRGTHELNAAHPWEAPMPTQLAHWAVSCVAFQMHVDCSSGVCPPQLPFPTFSPRCALISHSE